ncbi:MULTISPECIES: nucleoid-associated protein [unclassified Shewanella]|jgi:nucleoid-associated protein|uniref:nucleoid-associated protein n=1 Tax=unclassified Shewanella TaxID=196818 RepID=UPI0039B5FD55
MDGTIHNLIISSIKRDDKNTAISKTRDKENDVTKLSENVTTKLTTLFKGGGMKVGEFVTEPEESAFSNLMKGSFIRQDNSFKEYRLLSSRFAELLARKLNKAQAINAKDGFLITYYYSQTFGDEEVYYLCIVFLHRIDGTDINDAELTFEDIERINLDSLNLGAKICINDWVAGEPRPISFKLGRGTGDVRRYFQDFLGCTEPSDYKADTYALKDAINEACARMGIAPERAVILCESAQSYCNDRLRNYDEERVSLEGLSANLFIEEEERNQFLEIAHEEFKLSDTIGIDRSALRSFSRIQGENKDYKLSFNKGALNKSVIFDRKRETLTFSNLPKDILDEVLAYLPPIGERSD